MRKTGVISLLGTTFAFVLLFLRDCLQTNGMSNLRGCLTYGFYWLNWDGIESVAAFLALGLVAYLMLEGLSKPARAFAAIILPLISFCVCVWTR